MTDRDFLDSNILVYAYDRDQPQKQALAQTLLISGIENETSVVSAQVLSEFFTVATRRIPAPLSIDQAEEIINLVGTLDFSLVCRAISTHRQYGISYWDSLIVAAAERARCSRIISEDMNTGQSYHGIVAVNPF